ncbi:PEP-CTERM sorting domain-containing protein [Roseateles depolymerans]|uniref:PEP-CTERM protein-sorting domain-containing protein n=1 Tax=Roseateles depolymerans TaxID=76731 RepID=A0A0U3CG44_9BURK|nr:PEP-CTERM sorting domain-containing protein [Roseateles depolymerans]ALV07656.1 hypothetical protein RD2015_3196 [Roseateles depolymerans]REG22122.1 putative secreted protein with PEP-CTERM sorting signal [Roseateles depolymerans]
MTFIPCDMRRQAAALPLLVPLCFGLVSTDVAAQAAITTVSTTATASVFDEHQWPPTQSLDRPGSVSSHVALDRQSGGLAGSAWATAVGTVGYGHMQLRTFGGATLDGAGPVGEVSAYAEATASLYDSFMVSCPTCVAGTEATVTFRVRAEGTAAVDGRLVTTPDRADADFSAYSAVSSSFFMNATDANDPTQPVGTGMFQSELRWHYGGSYHDRPIWGDTLSARFILGNPLSFSWSSTLQGNSRVANYTEVGSMAGWSAFNADYSSTFYWGGIVEVRDSSGALLTDITAFNDSGINYANALPPTPVPEPATLWLMLCGAAGVMALARWRREPAPRAHGANAARGDA